MALPELVSTLYEEEKYNPKLQYMTGVSRDDAAYLLCKYIDNVNKNAAKNCIIIREECLIMF